MTLDLDKLKKLSDAATPGPWTNYNNGIYRAAAHHGGNVCDICPETVEHKANAEFIAAARTAVPQLIEEVEKQREMIEKLEDVLRWYACLKSEIHHLNRGMGQILSRYDIGQKAREVLMSDSESSRNTEE